MDQIGRYRILDELGRGATGVVYRAQDPAIGRIIAIKTIRLFDITDESERERLRERLFREAQSAGILSHPNIVTIYDIAEENGLAYIFMECVEGAPLEKALNSADPIPGENALLILQQTALALDYAHYKGIVHRDIKPANILIHENTHAKITDFGVAKIMSQQMTQSGVMMGTPNYMSPEQVQGHAVDGRADQFSLAVIAYEMLTGEKPFLAEQLPALLYRIVREDPVPPQRLNPTVGPQVEGVLRKALAKAANDRYATCVEFVNALGAALQGSPGWHPLPRSSAHSMPTIAGVAAELASEQPRPSPPRLGDSRSDAPPVYPGEGAEPRSRALRSLVWMLVGIGLVGLVLFGAQKYLFNSNSEQPVAEAPATDAPQVGSSSSVEKSPKPSPVGQPQLPDDSAKAAAPAAAPASTTPENHESTAPEIHVAPPAPARSERSASANVEPPKPGAGQSVQFLTDPPGAQVTIDGSASLGCKTPCMLALTTGRHAATIQLAGYRPYPRVFNVPQDGDLFLQLTKASGTVSIVSNPAGASIELDGMLQSKRTPAVFNLPPGAYHVKVARSGAFLDFDIQIRDGELTTKRVDF